MTRTLPSQFLHDRIEHLLLIEELFESYFEYNPVASWYKRYDPIRNVFIMERVNESYSSLTGIASTSYEGQEDSSVWEDDAASAYAKNDMFVIRTRRVIPICEVSDNPATGRKEVWVGWKWPHIKEGIVQGVWGLANNFEYENWMKIREDHPFYIRYKKQLEKLHDGE